MDRSRSKYSSEVAAIWLQQPRNIVRNKSHLVVFVFLCFPFGAVMDQVIANRPQVFLACANVL